MYEVEVKTLMLVVSAGYYASWAFMLVGFSVVLAVKPGRPSFL